MSEIGQHKKAFEGALVGLLNNWRVWFGDDELRAIHIGFDSSNTEITVSLLTDREPYLDQEGIEPFGDRWPTADWRLTDVNATYRHRFPDAAGVLEWMEKNAAELSSDDLYAFNQNLKAMLFEVATSAKTKEFMSKFRHVATPIRLRVEWFFDSEPLDACIELA